MLERFRMLITEAGNAGKAVTEEIRRAITNGSGLPSSEDLERTSSFESSSIGASTLHDVEVERVGFPSESDSFRLSRLIGSYTNRTANDEKERICIKRASSRPYRDSDSDSSSSTATSPVLSAGRQSLARSTPSLNTTVTSEHGSKKDLRSNKKSADSRRNHSPGSDFALGRQISNSSGQSTSPSDQTENGQNEHRTNMRSGTLPNSNSKPRLLDLAAYHLSSSRKNLSASTDSGQAPLSLQADTGSEMELFEQSQSSGSRTKLSSDASDNETPIDSYFMDHLSKEEEIQQAKLTEDVYCSDPLDLHPQMEDVYCSDPIDLHPQMEDVYRSGPLDLHPQMEDVYCSGLLDLHPQMEDLTVKKDESGNPKELILLSVEMQGSEAKYKDSDGNENDTRKEGAVDCLPVGSGISNNPDICCNRKVPNFKAYEMEADLCSLYIGQNEEALKIEPGNESKADIAVEPRFDPDEREDQTQHHLINNSKNKAGKSPESNKSTVKPETGTESADLTASLSKPQELISPNSKWITEADQGEMRADFTSNHSTIIDHDHLDQENREKAECFFIDENVKTSTYINGPSENSCENDNQESYAISDSTDDQLGSIDLHDNPDWKSEVIFKTRTADDQLEMIGLFAIDWKEYILDASKTRTEHKHCDQLSLEFSSVSDSCYDAEKPKNTGHLEMSRKTFERDICDKDSQLLEDQFPCDQVIPESLSVLNSCNEESKEQGDLEMAKRLIDSEFSSLNTDQSSIHCLQKNMEFRNGNPEDNCRVGNFLFEGDASQVVSSEQCPKEQEKWDYFPDFVESSFDASVHESQRELLNAKLLNASADHEDLIQYQLNKDHHLKEELPKESGNCETEKSQQFSESEIKTDSLKDPKFDSLQQVGIQHLDHFHSLSGCRIPETRDDCFVEISMEEKSLEVPMFSASTEVALFNLYNDDFSPVNHQESSGEHGSSSVTEGDVSQNHYGSAGQLLIRSELEELGQLPIMHEQQSDICKVLPSAPEKEICTCDPLPNPSAEEVHVIYQSMGKPDWSPGLYKEEQPLADQLPYCSEEAKKENITDQFGKSEEQAQLSASCEKDIHVADQLLSPFEDVFEADQLLNKSENEAHLTDQSLSSSKKGDNITNCLTDTFEENVPENDQNFSRADIEVTISEQLKSKPEEVPSSVYKEKDSIVDQCSNSFEQDMDKEKDSIVDQCSNSFEQDMDKEKDSIVDQCSNSFEQDMDNIGHSLKTPSSIYLSCESETGQQATDNFVNTFDNWKTHTLVSGSSLVKDQERKSPYCSPDHFSRDQMVTGSFPGPNPQDTHIQSNTEAKKCEKNERLSDLELSDSLNKVSQTHNRHSVEMVEAKPIIYSLESQTHNESSKIKKKKSTLEQPLNIFPEHFTLLKNAVHDTSFMEKCIENDLENPADVKSLVEPNLSQEEDYLPEESLLSSHRDIPEIEHLGEGSGKSPNMDISLENKISGEFQNRQDSEFQHIHFPEANSEHLDIPQKEPSICNIQPEAGTDSSMEYSSTQTAIVQDENEPGIARQDQLSKSAKNSEEKTIFDSVLNAEAFNRQDLPLDGSSTNAEKKHDKSSLIGFQPDLLTELVTLAGNTETLPMDFVSGASSVDHHNNDDSISEQSENSNVYLGQESDCFKFQIQPKSNKLNVFPGDTKKMHHDSALESGPSDVKQLKFDLSVLPEGSYENNEINKEISQAFTVSSTPDGKIENSEFLCVAQLSQGSTSVSDAEIDFPGVKPKEESLETLANQTRAAGKGCNKTEGSVSLEKDLENLDCLQNIQRVSHVKLEALTDDCVSIKEDYYCNQAEKKAHQVDISQTKAYLSPQVKKRNVPEFLLQDQAESTDEQQYVECQNLNFQDPYKPLFNDALDLKKVYFGSEDLSPDSGKLEIQFKIRENTDEPFGDQTFGEVDSSNEDLDFTHDLGNSDSGNSESDYDELIDPVSDRYSSESFFQEANPLDEMCHSMEEATFRQEFSQIPNSSLVSHSRHFLEAIPEQVFEDSNEEETEIVCLEEPSQLPVSPNARTDSSCPINFKSQHYETDKHMPDVGFKRVTYTVIKDEDIDEEFWGPSTFPISLTRFSKSSNQSLPEMNKKMYSGTCLETDIDSVLDLHPQNLSRPCQLDFSESSCLDLKDNPVDSKSPCESGSSEFSLLEYSPGFVTPLSLDSELSPMSPLKESTPFGSLRDMILEDERLARERVFQFPPPKNKIAPEPDRYQKTLEPPVLYNSANENLWQNNESNIYELGKNKHSEPMAAHHTSSNLENTVSLDPSPVIHLPKPDPMIPHRPKSLPHPFTITATPSPLDALPSLSKEKTVLHHLSYQPSKYPGEGRKVGSQKSNGDALTDVSQSRTYSGGGGGGGVGGGGRDDISDSSSLHTTPEHWLNGNKRKADLDASLPSITISEAEGSVSVRDESEEENNDLLKGSQSFRSGQSMTSSLGLTSMGSRDSLSSYYSNAGEINYGKINVTGDIQFGLDYDYKTVCLEIRIKQCRDLAPADMKKCRSDPYVKSYLLPDKSKTGKRKTKVKKNTLNPVFDEILRYSIAKSELENRTLWLTVWHNDRFGRNDFLGEVTIPFDYYRFEGPTLKWYSLQQRQEFTPSSLAYKGELSISLKYITTEDVLRGSTTSLKHSRGGGRSPDAGTGGQLHVFIKEARNLTAVHSGGYSDPFCKGYLLPEKNRSSKQKTPVVKKNCNPVWNHLFVFEDVSANELSDRCLELTLWDYDRLSSNDFLGGIRLNLGSGIFGRKYVDWMDASGAEISLWQSMISCPNTWVDGTLILRANMNNRK